VLSQAPDNLKVLYRRALAYEAMANFSKSLEDIQKILQLDPTNQLALKTRERLQKVLPASASSSSPRSPSAPLASKPQHQGSPSQAQSAAPPEETSEDWKLETAKKEALKFLQNGSVEKAVAVLEGALSDAEVAADSDQLLSLRQLLAGAYTSLEDYQKVLKVSEAILHDHPNNFKALSRAGDAAYHLVCPSPPPLPSSLLVADPSQGQTARAKEYATRVLRVDPINADARVLLDALEEQSKPPSPPPPSPSPASASGSRSPLSPAHPSVSMSSLTLSPETEALSLQKKNEGNEAMKSGDFSLAIDRYSEAIALDSSNMMFFNNRAQAYLKIAHFPAAESDSTVVINSNPRLPNLKALFRRALARKGIGTKQSLQEGLQDLNAILNAEPANKEAKLERGKLQVMLAGLVQREEEAEEKRRLEEERERMKLLPSSERIVDESGIVARKTVLLKKNQSSRREESEQHELTEVATSPKKKGGGEGSPVQTLPASAGSGSAVKSSPSTPQSTSRSPATAAATSSPASHSKDPTKRMISVATPTLPTEPPKTVYELERVWRGMKNHPALFGQYLRLFKRTTFKKVIKETVSPDLISSILLAVKEHLLVTDSAAALVVLEGLTKTPKFEILLSILPEEDLCCIRDCVEHLATHADRERGDKLKEAYHL
jgi:tetratricopeptide (TPR) repeat protein